MGQDRLAEDAEDVLLQVGQDRDDELVLVLRESPVDFAALLELEYVLSLLAVVPKTAILILSLF